MAVDTVWTILAIRIERLRGRDYLLNVMLIINDSPNPINKHNIILLTFIIYVQRIKSFRIHI